MIDGIIASKKRLFANVITAANLLLFLAGAAYSFYSSAETNAQEIKEKTNIHYKVWLKDSKASSSFIRLPKELILIGSTEKHNFFYHRQSKKSFAIPIVNIQIIEIEDFILKFIKNYNPHRKDRTH